MKITAERNKQDVVRNDLVNWLQEMQPGTRLLPERELASMFSVSRCTIRNAVDGLVQAGLLTRIQGNGVYVSESSSTRKWRVCLVYGKSKNPMDDPFVNELLRCIELELSKRGWILAAASMSETDRIMPVGARDADGLVITQRLDPSIIPAGKPVTYFDPEEHYLPNCSAILVDECLSGRMAYEYLHSLGHTKIGFVGETVHSREHLWIPARYQGACVGARNASLPEPPLMDCDGTNWSRGQIAKEIQSAGMTAVICANDYVAVKLISVLHKQGLVVPEDLSIIGFDDLPATASFEPHLTTVKLPVRQMASLAVSELDQRFTSQEEVISKRIMLPVSLVVKDSCLPYKGSAEVF